MPVAAGSENVTSTAMVGVLLPEPPEEQESVPGAAALELDPPGPELDGQVATLATEETTPGVVRLFGRVMLTLSPTATSDCCEAANASCTWRTFEVVATSASYGTKTGACSPSAIHSPISSRAPNT